MKQILDFEPISLQLGIKRKLKTDRHISKQPGRGCFACNGVIKYGDECYTETYMIKQRSKRLQLSYHLDCLNVDQ